MTCSAVVALPSGTWLQPTDSTNVASSALKAVNLSAGTVTSKVVESDTLLPNAVERMVRPAPARLGITPRYERRNGGVHCEFPVCTPQLGLKEHELSASLDDGCLTSCFT